MSDFLTRLAERQLGRIETIEPRIKPLFAPTAQESQAPALGDDFVTQPLPRLDDKAATSPARSIIADSPRPEQPPLAEPRLVATQTPALERAIRSAVAPAKIDADLTQPAPNRAASRSMAAIIAPIQAPAKMPSFDAPKLEDNTASISAAPLLPTRVNSELAPPPRKTSTVNVPAESEIKLTAPSSLSPRRDRVDERARPVADVPVQVTIGRIEVTALVQAAPSKRPAPARKPTLSLDDYLARRHGRER